MEEREKLALEIQSLQEREEYYTKQLELAYEKEPVQADLTAVQEKLAAKKAQLEQLDNAGVVAQAEIYSRFESIVFGGDQFSVRQLCVDDISYQIMTAWIQMEFGSQAEAAAVVAASYQSQVDKLKEDLANSEAAYNELSKTNDDLLAESSKIKDELYELTLERDDLSVKRDAAAAQIEALEDEKKRLADDNESLRKQLATPARPSQTNDSTSAAELVKQYKASRPAIVNKRWKDQNSKTAYLAELVSTGETIEIPWLNIGQYREVTPEEAATFQPEAAPAPVVVDAPAVEVVEEVLDSPSAETGEDASVQADAAAREVVQDSVTREEFAALQAEVSNIKRVIGL
jgi:chromosome segregation ATPase